MKFNVSEDFDVFELFVADSRASGGLDQEVLAEALNEELAESGWRVEPPQALNRERFTMFDTNTETYYEEDCYSVDQVKDYLPLEAVQALEELNSMALDLSSRAGSGA